MTFSYSSFSHYYTYLFSISQQSLYGTVARYKNGQFRHFRIDELGLVVVGAGFYRMFFLVFAAILLMFWYLFTR